MSNPIYLYKKKHMGNYIIYKYTSPSGGVYIGQTHNDLETRAGNSGKQYCYSGKQTAIARAIKKYGWDSFQKEILFTGLTSDEADQKEKELIKEYREKGECYNICSGGKGVPGTRDHKVCQYSLDGEYIKTWDTIKEAESWLGIKHAQANIVQCCQGKKRRAYGYIWRYIEEQTERVASLTPYRSPVCQFSKTGQLLATYPTIKAASDATGIGETSIGNNLRGRSKSAGGFSWKFESLA